MHGGDDWDLAAVVRGCCSRAKPAAAAAAADPLLSSVFAVEKEEEKGGEHILANQFFPDHLARTRNFDGLEGLYNPFLIRQSQQQQQPEHPVRIPQGEESTLGVARKTHRPAPAQPPRSKRRKKQMKKVVCQVPADGVSSDMWAWRKYGQKPIKGSPYPRGYYRCSSFRGCPARKQVERNRTDPGQHIVTYTAEHSHPAPPRRKFPSTPPLATTAATTTSSSVSDSALAAVQDRAENYSKENDQLVSSPATSVSVDGDEEGELMVEDMEIIGEDELVFMGDALETGEGASSWFDDDDDGDGGGEFEDRLFASPWLESGNNGSATAAAC